MTRRIYLSSLLVTMMFVVVLKKAPDATMATLKQSSEYATNFRGGSNIF